MENGTNSKITQSLNGHATDPILPNDPTIGYKLNHSMMKIRDPKQSMEFYTSLMGMRQVFSVNAGIFTIYYLAYPETDEHRADPAKFAIDTTAKLTSTLGLLELLHIHGSEKHEPGFYATGITPPNLGFGHLGFTVPNVQQAVARLRAHGVPILKDAGSCDTSLLVTDWEKQRGVGVSANGTDGKLHPDHAGILEQVAFVQDPDGYLIELVPQTLALG